MEVLPREVLPREVPQMEGRVTQGGCPGRSCCLGGGAPAHRMEGRPRRAPGRARPRLPHECSPPRAAWHLPLATVLALASRGSPGGAGAVYIYLFHQRPLFCPPRLN